MSGASLSLRLSLLFGLFTGESCFWTQNMRQPEMAYLSRHVLTITSFRIMDTYVIYKASFDNLRTVNRIEEQLILT